MSAPDGRDKSAEDSKSQEAVAASPSASSPSRPLPEARLAPERRISWAWLLTLAALIFASWLGWRAWTMRGTIITIHFDEGHGLKTGDAVRYRGIIVGEVRAVHLADDLRGVSVTAALTAESDRLARSGTHFWVVRPQLGLNRVEGLETLIGPRYLAALPVADAAPGAGAAASATRAARAQRQFIGLDQPPIVEMIEAGDLEIILQSMTKGSLQPGAPVTYRRMQVGTVLSVGLAGDGGAVEARVHIQQPYVPLIRPQTRFWDVGGVQAHMGITGVTIDVESAESLLIGGVALATPPDASEVVRTGHRFDVAREPEREWLEWQPLVAIGSSMLPPGAAPPQPLRATLGWTQGRWFSREKSRQGWVLQTEDGLLGPASLLIPGAKADRQTVVLEVAGVQVPLGNGALWERNGLALLPAHVSKSVWPAARVRAATEPEECLAIADSAAAPLPLAASRLTPVTNEDGSRFWTIDPAVPIDSTWHGGSVVSRADGALIGILLVDDDEARVALLQAP